MIQLPRTATSAQGLTGGTAYSSIGRADRSDSSDGSSEMSYESKARTSKGGLFCRALASIKTLVVQQDEE